MISEITSLPVYKARSRHERAHAASRGFSLLEVTIALSISGLLFNAIWQLTAASGVQREAAGISSQATIVSAAANSYINGQKTTLLALPELAAIGDVARIKITDADTGDTATSVQGMGYLPEGFTNINSYGQEYALFVRREDAGSMGVVDASDRLVGLLITTGGEALSDQIGAKIAANMGAAGGFLYADSNPAAPTAATTARGSAGGWEIDLDASGWNDIGSVAKAGRLAMLTTLLPASSGGGTSGGGATDIDGLEDGMTDYANSNMYMGEGAGQGLTSATTNLGIGVNAMRDASTQFGNVVLGNGAGVDIMGNESVVIGTYAGSGSAGAVRSRSVAIGSEAMRYGQAESSVGIGYGAMTGYNGGQSVGIGWGALYNGTGNHNVGIGGTVGSADPIGVVLTSGSQNVMIGASAMRNLSSGNNNVALGFLAGVSATTGSNNINIGASTDVAVATADNQLNIGNTIYGNLSTDQVNIGSATMVAGIAFDVGSNTSASRLSVGTVAQRPACNASMEGAQRWNSQTQTMEACTGGVWMLPSPAWVPVDGTPPIPHPYTGYYVLSAGQWDGNLGGFSGANAKCYSDLTANDWNGKAEAISRGILTPSKVVAWVCYSNNVPMPCQSPLPLTTYRFATSGDPISGGGSHTTDENAKGPGNTYNWSAANYFSASVSYWTGQSTADPNWGTTASWTYTCGGWSSTSGTGITGVSSTSDTNRWRSVQSDCSIPNHLICIVNP